MGELLSNPAAKSVLVALIPEVVNNPNLEMGKALPLQAIAQFEPTLTTDKLAQIDAALAKVPR